MGLYLHFVLAIIYLWLVIDFSLRMKFILKIGEYLNLHFCFLFVNLYHLVGILSVSCQLLFLYWHGLSPLDGETESVFHLYSVYLLNSY